MGWNGNVRPATFRKRAAVQRQAREFTRFTPARLSRSAILKSTSLTDLHLLPCTYQSAPPGFRH
jgi:hypothetical protein